MKFLSVGGQQSRFVDLCFEFVDEQLQAVDVSRTHSSASTDVLDVIQVFLQPPPLKVFSIFVRVDTSEAV